MTYFNNVISREELKTAYRRLVMAYHPDRGGDVEIMKKINYEYTYRIKKLDTKPRNLKEVTVGHIVMVNNARSIVTEVFKEYFKARSLETNREAYFSKTSGFAMLNFKFKAEVL
jgi:hypothetical protein